VLILNSCSTTKKLEVTTISQALKIEKKPRPRALVLSDPRFYVVTEKNFETFKADFMKTHSTFTLFVLDENGYKKLVTNQNELKRYIAQQNSIIVYYEKATEQHSSTPTKK